MSDEWDFYALRVADQPASIMLDMGIAREAPLRRYATAGYLRVRMRRPRPDGLSSQEEFEDLTALGDAVTAEIAERGKAVYVGRNTSDGNRDFYFYTREATRFCVAVEAAMARFPHYQFECGHRPDPDWGVYFDFLYPSPRDRQRMLNRAVVSALEKKGDQLDAPREIDHWAIFPSLAACEEYRTRVEALGFTVADGFPEVQDQEARLSFVRVDRPSAIDDFALDLWEAAESCGGEYDGWGCEIVPKP